MAVLHYLYINVTTVKYAILLDFIDENRNVIIEVFTWFQMKSLVEQLRQELLEPLFKVWPILDPAHEVSLLETRLPDGLDQRLFQS